MSPAGGGKGQDISRLQAKLDTKKCSNKSTVFAYSFSRSISSGNWLGLVLFLRVEIISVETPKSALNIFLNLLNGRFWLFSISVYEVQVSD